MSLGKRKLYLLYLAYMVVMIWMFVVFFILAEKGLLLLLLGISLFIAGATKIMLYQRIKEAIEDEIKDQGPPWA